jgi:hypothetical protein
LNWFTNALSAWGPLLQVLGWGTLILLPPAILLLYFLKLRREPLQVPSTYLWSRTIEDLHVNSIWQRLRRSLLLFLQLLFAGLLLFTLLRPGCRGTELTGERFIFLIDVSASMAATENGKTRLEIAKARTQELIDGMKGGDTAMLISFSDHATIEQSFVDNRGLLRRKLAAIEQSQRRTDLDEALRAASGLANPGRVMQEGRELETANALRAQLYIMTDGGVKKVPEFMLGNLEPVYIPIGNSEQIDNLGIIDFSVEANSESPNQREAFARIYNSGSQEIAADLSLYLNDKLRDSMSGIAFPAGESKSVPFDLSLGGGLDVTGVLRLEIERSDDLLSDNTAYAIFNPPRKSKILLVTTQNTVLQAALDTTELRKISLLQTETPSHLASEDYRTNAESGYYDLIIYDGCAPPKMPQANTLFINAVPPDSEWSLGAKQGRVQIVDFAQTHPLLSMVDLRNVLVAEAAEVIAPKGSVVLVDSNLKSIFSVGPRGGYQDAVMGFMLGDANTDWPRYISFPIFAQNLVVHLGSRSSLNTRENVVPGKVVQLRSSTPVTEMRVTNPNKKIERVASSRENLFVYSDTGELGVYDVSEGSSQTVDQQFAVNILDERESDLRIAEKLEIGFETVPAQPSSHVARQEYWKWILIAGLILLCIEWYIYNKRIYL